MSTGVSSKPNPLSAAERADLVRLEQVIDRGRGAFRQTALALCEIKARQLWREDFSSFEQFLERRLGLSKWSGGTLATAGWIIRVCEEHGLPEPKSLRQARNIARALNAGPPRGRPSNSPAATSSAPAPPADRVAKLRELLETPSAGRAKGYEKLHGVYAGEVSPTTDLERQVKEHVQLLRRIVDLHPCRDRALQLLDAYENAVFPWREAR